MQLPGPQVALQKGPAALVGLRVAEEAVGIALTSKPR